jgi:hypothetical protein
VRGEITFNCGGHKMTWYYWVLTWWIGLSLLVSACFLVLGLLALRRAARKSIRPTMAPSPVLTRPGGEKRVDEKRKFKRFKGKEAAFSVFMRSNELMGLGQIQDISIGGLCVQYVSTEEDTKGCSEIKIFGKNDRFIHLDRVQCRIVYDKEVPAGAWEQIITRRCGVEFENLSVKHLSLLQEFIDHFAFVETQASNARA